MSAMSQTSDGHGAIPQDAITSTLSGASAFGDDLDDSYSVSEASHYDGDGRRSGKSGAKRSDSKKGASRSKRDNIKFSNKSRLKPLQRVDSVEQSSQQHNGNGTETSGSTQQRIGSSESGENKSDEASSSPNSGDPSDDPDLTLTTFASFAQTRFQTKIPYTYGCSALQEPLLPKPDKAEYLAAMSAWVTLLRIMGDMPDADVGDSLIVTGVNSPVVNRIKNDFGVKYTKKDIEDFQKKYSDLFKDPSGTDVRAMPFLTKSSDTMLDKIQMFCALGIYKPSLRDELYCQLCKQLTGNPSRNSTARGWVLMYLMVSSFAPSEQFIPCLTTFLGEGPLEFADKVDLRLRRTCSVGTRGYPPSWLEFQAAKNGKPLLIPITFMNGNRMLYEMDGATTVGELLNGLGQRLGIKNTGGFSVFITLQNKISCLGNGMHRIMDAISECEQHSKMMGVKEANSTWRLFMRQEYFSPRQMVSTDAISTDLAYHQIIKGISLGEYMFEKEDQLINMAAMIYKAEFPDDDGFQKVQGFLSDFVPENIQERRAEGYYKEKVVSIVANNYPESLNKDATLALKRQVVHYVRDEFNVMFSRYYDASRVLGQGFQLPDMIVGVNHKGIFLIDNQDKVRTAIDFSEVVEVVTSKNHAILTLIGQGELDLTMNHVDDFADLINGFLNGLSEVSTLALAVKDWTPLDELPESSILKGDLLEMGQPLKRDKRKNGNIRVLCTRTSMSADVPVDMLHILNTIFKPKKDTLSRLVTQMRKDISAMIPSERICTSGNLRQYAKSKFRNESESSVSKFLNKASFKRKGSKHENLWQYSKEPIKKPLLKKTCARDDVRKMACHTFTSIQTYMAQLSINDENSQYHLCHDWVLDPARRNKYIRDEIYCQVVKQLTNNPNRENEDRGWVLLCLLTSLTSPSPNLADHIVSFVKASTHSLASRCLSNITMQSRQGAYRLYSSHPMEHSMISKQQHNIRFPIYFPNQTTQTVELTNQTRIFEIKKLVASRLKLKSFAEYSLFLTTNDKVHCLLDRAFFFDCLSHAETYWFRNQRRQSGKTPSTPMLVMLKKIWINARPGDDQAADTVFHFPQELPNYVRAYHDINMPNQMIRIAALVYRALYGDDETNFSKFGEISSQIFPQNFLLDNNIKELQQSVKGSYDSTKGMNQLEAKIKFLDEIASLSTYGSVFFEVKQRHVKSIPPLVLIAINFAGVHIVEKDSKKILKSYEFYCIPNWAYDENSFTFIFNNGNNTSKLLVETKVGHNIDDLLMSYIAWMMNFQMRQKYGYIGASAGESIC